ncbi:MAG TPA: hypothetical protein VKI17_09565, partial [Gemmataceae bacterium]|nr:hypothetical protein [Gemmataceae bacterium]
VFAGGQDRRVRVAEDAKILDAKGKDLADGLKSKELKEGADVILTVERGDNGPVVKTIQLGRRAARAPQDPPEKVELGKLKPLSDMANGDEYKGYKGGLYPEASKTRPPAHEAAGQALARQVQPLDADGNANPDGKIGLLSIGMSNTNQAFSGFMRVARGDKDVNPHVVLVNGAQGGMTAFLIQSEKMPRPLPQGRTGYWEQVDNLLKQAGVTRAQVQAIWLKQADAGPSQGFPRYAQTLQEELANIVRLLHRRFPKLKLVYLSSRTFGGWAKTRLNPEPYAYESGFSVKWLIKQQIKGDLSLNYDAARGEVKAPWLSWGPYLWANGTSKRTDGFSYDETDFTPADGTHESQSGQLKVGRLLLEFFKTDSTTRPWFVRKEG